MKYLILVVVFILLILLIRLIHVATSPGRFAGYWQNEAKKPTQPNSLIYMALGDSLSQGVGASSPAKGMIGILANRISTKTGRPVHVINISKSGARIADVLKDQLPLLLSQNPKPDIITLDIGSNDLSQYDIVKFDKEFSELAAQLPKDSIVIEISPYFKGKAVAANEIINRHVKDNGLVLSSIKESGVNLNLNWLEYSGDFFHPSNRGYKKWADVFWAAIEPTITN